MDNESKKTSTVKKSTNGGKTPSKTTSKKTTTSKTGKTTKKSPAKVPVKKSIKVEAPKEIKKEEVKEVPVVKETKNIESLKESYIAILVIVIAFILLTIMLVKNFMDNNADYSKSYLLSRNYAKKVESTGIDNINGDNQTFVLVTKLNDEEEYNLEKDLKSVIMSNNLVEDFYILDASNEDVDLKSMYNIDVDVPTILYFKNGKLVDFVKRDDPKMIEAADFAKLLDIYEITK